jgi:hypothetical protein
MPTLSRLTVRGFKSIRALEDFELGSLNVLIGANGAGKSNFIGLFRMLSELVARRLQLSEDRARSTAPGVPALRPFRHPSGGLGSARHDAGIRSMTVISESLVEDSALDQEVCPFMAEVT